MLHAVSGPIKKEDKTVNKHITRLLAMLLCVLAFAALLPVPALAALETDKVAPAVELIAENAAAVANAKVCTKTFKLGTTITFKANPLHPSWIPKYQWQRKAPGSSKWANIKSAKESKYSFKVTTGKNGYTYRCMITYKLLKQVDPTAKPEYTREIKIKVKK